ncbi:undecaprenyl-diphosphate phosphatase [Candidatus Thioglobus sp. NP1]|uniref:undecaprenyl-diphosphate phosphatase n=1 Tax=Candidatus Thioglobus sp. NP1 TaxID=2508687 RepID=UPI000DEDA628|nr:undecaprenyl-diphosphate phosphatase [Candidatus Thioglobus sp. NP1]AXE62351.1 undecaprenyl-diphosphatase [Candidatus Thioglobus sp. NP1]
MDITQTITLALIQGLTEFLPISSSAHLVILPKFLDWPDQGLAFDVVLHFATLCAIIFYYRTTLVVISKDFFSSIVNRRLEGEAMLAWAILLGTIPVGLTGILFEDYIVSNFRSYHVVAFATIFFGILLGFSDWIQKTIGKSRDFIRGSDILIIGCFQALALIPGVSRSGITITAALFIGLSRALSIKYAFLLSIPVITLATLLKTFELSTVASQVDWTLLLMGFIIAFIAAYTTIVFFIRLVERIGFMPFVIYRILLGALLFLL